MLSVIMLNVVMLSVVACKKMQVLFILDCSDQHHYKAHWDIYILRSLL
jgi:hypothetical protein